MSRSRRGNGLNNAPMERFFHTLEVKLVYQRPWATRNKVRRELFSSVGDY